MKKFFIGCLLVFVSACTEDIKPYSLLAEDAIILAFGDSLTYGTGTNEASSYPSVLENLTGLEVINAGIPGEISATGLQRLDALLAEYQPQMLILVHGGNDILRKIPSQKTAANLIKMITFARQRGIKVVMLGVPSFSFFSLQSAAIYEQVASQQDIPINLDILPKILAANNLKSDRIHPNKQGYQMMAEAVYKLLQKSGALL